MEPSNSLELLFHLFEVATIAPTSCEKRYNTLEGPVDFLTERLNQAVKGTYLCERVNELTDSADVATTSKGALDQSMKEDGRIKYSQLIAVIFNELSKCLSNRPSENDFIILSVPQMQLLENSIEFFVIIGLLPALDSNVGIPVEKRTSFIKYWKPFECVSIRRVSLKRAAQVFLSLARSNDAICTQIIHKFMLDFIATNEQLLQLECTDYQQDYEQFLEEKVPKSMVFREYLTLLGVFTIASRQRRAPKWLQKSISIRLSKLLLTKDSLSNLFSAFNDLGSPSFWENSAALYAVATLLVRKPASTKASAYYRFILKQFMELLKNPIWSNKIGRLFVSTVDLFLKKATSDLKFQVIDKLTSPWEICLERGKHNPSSIDYGYWNSYLDDSLWIIKSWFSSIHAQTEIPFIERFDNLCHFLLHLCGQAYLFKELETFAYDSALVIRAIISRMSEPGDALIKMILSQEKTRLFEFYKIGLYKKPLVQEFTESKNLRKYSIHLEIMEKPFSEQEMLDWRINAVDGILKQLNPEDSSNMLVDLLSATIRRWNYIGCAQTDGQRKDTDDEYLPFVDELDQSKFDEHRVYWKTQYILSTLAEKLMNWKIQLSDVALLKMLEISEMIVYRVLLKLKSTMELDVYDENELDVDVKSTDLSMGLVSCVVLMADNSNKVLDRLKVIAAYLKEFSQITIDLSKKTKKFDVIRESLRQLLDLFRDLSIDTPDVKAISTINVEFTTPNRPKNNTLSLTLTNLLKDLDDTEEHVKGHALIAIGRELRRRNTKLFHEASDFDVVYEKILHELDNPDTYVFLAAINALSELAYWKTEPYLSRLVDHFAIWPFKDDETRSLVIRTKVGETISKVFKNLGDFSPLYFDRLASTFLWLVKEPDELIRASALSSLADLITACRGRRFDKMLNELLLCISQILINDKSPLVRRAAVHLLRSMLSSAHDVLFEVFVDSLRDINRQLRRLWENDMDDVVRLQAELALIEIKESISDSINKI